MGTLISWNTLGHSRLVTGLLYLLYVCMYTRTYTRTPPENDLDKGLLFPCVTIRVTNNGLLAHRCNNRPHNSCILVRNCCVIKESIGRSPWTKVSEWKATIQGRDRHMFLWQRGAKVSDVLRRASAICRIADEKCIRTLRSTRPDELTETDGSGHLSSNTAPTHTNKTSTISSLE